MDLRTPVSHRADAASTPVVTAAPARLISLCVGTFRRPDGIVAAVRSLLVQPTPAGCDTEIIVVDNDPAGSAQAALDTRLSPAERARVRYVIEPRPGVSHVRNRCLTEARGEIVTFIDDDEWAEPDWLARLVDTLERTQADAAFGPVLPRYEGTAPAWLTEGHVHAPARFPSGTVIEWGYAKTGNVALRRTMFDGTAGFASQFARTGGEDSYFFAQAIRRGRRLVWCDEAVVHESVPAERMTRRWTLERAFHGGRTYVRLRRALDMPWAYPVMGLYGLVYALLLLPPLLATWLARSPRHMRYACKFAGNLGKIVARFYHSGKYGA
jgi:glycosyltransferase involved in cell wall biosynthesis